MDNVFGVGIIIYFIIVFIAIIRGGGGGRGGDPLMEDGGLVTHLTQVHLGPTQDQTPLVAGMVAASMAVVHPMIGDARIKFKEISRFRYEK